MLKWIYQLGYEKAIFQILDHTGVNLTSDQKWELGLMFEKEKEEFWGTTKQ
jgi:hypothetical protein